MKALLYIVGTLLCFYNLCAQLPTGFIAKYPLNNSATDITGNGYNGTLTSTSATTNHFGNANGATSFTSGTSKGSLPLALVTAVQNDFSFGYWFKTSMTASSNSQWYGGNAMVDAEVCGGTNDWGTALIDGGKVCFGIGNPDITIKTTAATYNDNAWHFVTATRNKAAGTIILYIDGALASSTSGTNTGVLSAPSFVGLANNPCVPSGVFTGSLDDIIVYNRVLSAVEVGNLFTFLSATALPLAWLSFTQTMKGNSIDLKWEIEKAVNNDHFDIEHSLDGIHFSSIGSLKDNAYSSINSHSVIYSFLAVNLANGTHYFRIRQVDTDGSSSLSKTIQASVHNTAPGFYLQSNPVTDKLVLVNSNQTMVMRLQVCDMSGKILTDLPVHSSNSSISTNVQFLKAGAYLLRIGTTDGVKSLPLVKQ